MAFRSAKLTQVQDMNMKNIEEKVNKAKHEKKIFIVLGRYDAIRNGLVLRGWLEKVLENQMLYIPPSSERLLVANFLKNSAFNFIWQPKFRPIKVDETKKPFVNSILRQRSFDFTTKDGLKNCVDSFQWNSIDGLTELNYYPRTYILDDKSVKEEFFDDYRQTAFIGFIKYLDSAADFSELFSNIGHIPTDCIEFTIQKIELLMRIHDHEDIDMPRIFDACAKFPKDQKKMLHYIQQMIKNNKKFPYENDTIVEKLKIGVQKCSEEIQERWPNLQYDGFKNVWIFKPVGFSSGNGIILENNFEKIREIISVNVNKTFVVQKYIERPLLIHNRKFDIRIYLLTSIQNDILNIWLYKDCYVKFATKEFTLDDLHKSVHVTNYAVQKYFMNEQDAVPSAKENMWTLKQLIDYFQSIEKPRLWESKIYPAIKKILLAVIIPSLEGTQMENKNFELNGADFMITYDHEAVLIEVNSVPALFFTSTVMEMITNKLLDDVIKVVIDHSKDSSAYTGDFELIYSHQVSKQENVSDLSIVGKKVNRMKKRNDFKKEEPIDVKANSKVIEAYKEIADRFIYLKEN